MLGPNCMTARACCMQAQIKAHCLCSRARRRRERARVVRGPAQKPQEAYTSRTTSEAPPVSRSLLHRSPTPTENSTLHSQHLTSMMHPLRRFLLLLLVGLLPAAVWSLAPPRFPRPQPRSRPGVNGVGDYEYETRYFRQRLDHFSFPGVGDEDEAAAFFQQRYLVGRGGGWAGPGGPIFFYCGNEGDIAWFASNSGLVWEAAPRFAALVVFAEATVLPRPLVSYSCLFLVFTFRLERCIHGASGGRSLVCCAASLLRRVHAVR